MKLRPAIDSGAAMVALALAGLLAGAAAWVFGWGSAACNAVSEPADRPAA